MIENRPHQRKGSQSNAHVGRSFELSAHKCLVSEGILASPNFKLKVGIASRLPKEHSFDFGSNQPPVIVECKSHRWTEGDKVPSAKMATWNEAMYYFSLAPANYRRILFALRDERKSSGETLVDYYKRTYTHMIPVGVEIWEFNEVAETCKIHQM
jgi:hypothetical protein